MTDRTTHRTRTDVMQADWQNAIDLTTLPGGPAEFQRCLLAAENEEPDGSFAQLARLISIANAALVVISSGNVEAFEPWYREKATLILHRAMVALEVLEADTERRAESRLN